MQHNNDMCEYTGPDFRNDFKLLQPPLPRYLSSIGNLPCEPWSPLEPHSLGRDLELERKTTEITDITLDV